MVGGVQKYKPCQKSEEGDFFFLQRKEIQANLFFFFFPWATPYYRSTRPQSVEKARLKEGALQTHLVNYRPRVSELAFQETKLKTISLYQPDHCSRDRSQTSNPFIFPTEVHLSLSKNKTKHKSYTFLFSSTKYLGAWAGDRSHRYTAVFPHKLNTYHCHEYILYPKMQMSTKNIFFFTKMGPKNKSLGAIPEQ